MRNRVHAVDQCAQRGRTPGVELRRGLPTNGRLTVLLVVPRLWTSLPIGSRLRPDLQTRCDREFHQLGPHIQEEIDQGQTAFVMGIDLACRIDCARLRLMAVLFL